MREASMIVGAYCNNPKCKNGRDKTLYTSTELTLKKRGGWNGPWMCEECEQEMVTVYQATDKDDGQKRSPGKSYKIRIAKTESSGRPRKKSSKKKTSKRYITKRP